MEEFMNGLTLLDKVVTKLNQMKNVTSFSQVTFICFNIVNKEKIDILEKHPLTKNIILVSDLVYDKENVISIKPKDWENNKDELMKETYGSILIYENKILGIETIYEEIESFNKFYPVILMYSKLKLTKSKISEKNYSTYTEDNIYCMINKNIKSFDSYSLENLDFLKDYNVLGMESGDNIFDKKETGQKIPINLKQFEERKKKASPVTDKSHEVDFAFLENIPSPTAKLILDKYNRPVSKKWLQEFYEYLKTLLEKVFPEDRKNLIDVILTNDTLKKNWIPSFTHITANPNPGQNYEAIETIGDETIGYCFKFYIKQREPFATESRISNLNQKYMSKVFQSKVSNMMKLPEWLISVGIQANRMDNSEDLLESFCGTIDQILFNKSKKMGLGVIIIYNLIKLLFDSFTFETEEESNTDPDRTYVEQLFSGQVFRPAMQIKQQYTNLRRPKEIPEDLWDKVVKDINKKIEPEGINPVIVKKDTTDHPGISYDSKVDSNGKVTVIITILKPFAEIARKLGIDIPDRNIVIGKSTKNTKKIAEKEAYAQAKRYVVSKGMTKEWKESQKKQVKKMSLEKLDLVLEKAKRKYPTLVDVEVERTKTIKSGGQDVVIYQIIGEEENGRKVSIYTLVSQDKAYEQGVIDSYLDE